MIDLIAWIDATLVDPETDAPFELLPCEVAFLSHCFNLDDDGRAIYPELDYIAPKKSGKTTFGAILVLAATLLFGGPGAEAICAANDLEQSQSRVFAAIKRIIRASPKLCDMASMTLKSVIFANGSTITAIASGAAGAAGSNAVISIGDELWGYTTESSRRTWDELVTPATRKAAWRLVVSYAGFSGESLLLEERYKHAMEQPLIGDDLYAGEGHLCFWTHKPVAPWQTEAWLTQMRRSLRPNQYARMIECRWVSSESAFVDMDWFDRCVTQAAPVNVDTTLPVWLGVDASVKHDSTAVVAVTMAGQRVRVVDHRIFQPSPDQPLDFEATVERTVHEMCRRFDVRGVNYDPFQMAAVAMRLHKAGVPMREYPQTIPNLTAMGSNLFELIQAGGIEFYPNADIRLAISRTIALETSRGFRLSKEKSSHKIDVVIALAMAAQAAVAGLQEPLIPVIISVGLAGLIGSQDNIDDAQANWEACQAAAQRGDLRGADLAFYYHERARRMGATR